MRMGLLAATALTSGLVAISAAPAQVTENSTTPPVGPSSSTIAQTTAEDVAADDAQAIVITGSRIRRPNIESNAPVTSISGTEFFETGAVSIGDTLNDLPQLRNTFSQQNSTRFLGTRGLNLLDLYGLGTARTLVLVNGRRHVGSDVLNNAVSPDTNTFPTDLIERVDVLTGGASSIYGSDAVAGVVNFVLKQDFEGIQLRGQGGISQYGDAGNRYVSALVGKNFSEGRGNVAVNVEYANSDRYFGANRPNLRQNNGFIVVDTDPAGSVNGSDSDPDRRFFRDIRSSTLSLGGQTGIFQSATNAACGVDKNGAAFVCNQLFARDGSLAPQQGTRVGLGPNGSYIGGNGTSSREGELLTLTPNLERISINLIGHFAVSDAFVPFVEAKYVRTDAFGSQSGPFFSQGTTVGDPGGRERVRVDNPYLTTQARTALTQQLLATTVNANTGAALTAAGLAAQRAAVNAGTFRFNLRRNWVDFGIRDENIRRETYRAVVGTRGEFNEDWNYEVSVNYGEHKERNNISGNVNVQRYLLALDTTRDAAGNIVCRSKVNPAAATGYILNDDGLSADPARLANDIAACVPLNPFGQGNVSEAARAYILTPTTSSGKIKQFVASAFVAGDSSQLFELPGGAVGFSVGAEYRRERVTYDLDETTQAGYAFYNAIPDFRAPAFEVKELYAEISVPILKDVPFFHELTANASGRVSDYKGATGTVYTYGGELTWSPVQDLRLRATYNRAIRAPNLVDLYSEQSQNFAAAPNDPCSARNIGAGSATRAANCRAAGIPASYDFVYTSSIEIVSGGNPQLKEETSTSWTAGAVIQPRFIPGLTLSADYFNIKVDDVITAPSAQQILNACYDAPDLNNPFCGLFRRNGTGVGPQEESPFQVLQASLQQTTLNYAKLKVRGVNTELGYRQTFGWGSAGFRATWTRILQRDDFLNPADPNFRNRILSEIGDPKNQVNFTGDVKFGKVTIGYQMRWIDKMFLNTAEDYLSVNGQAPQNADYADLYKYPDVFYHDARVAVDVTERLNLYAGMDNIGNRQPPFGLTGVGAGSGIYDLRGRYAYIGAVAKF